MGHAKKPLPFLLLTQNPLSLGSSSKIFKHRQEKVGHELGEVFADKLMPYFSGCCSRSSHSWLQHNQWPLVSISQALNIFPLRPRSLFL